MARNFTEKVQAATAVLIAIGMLVVAISDTTAKLENLLTDLGLPIAGDWLIWTTLVVLLLVAISLLRRGLSRKSRLLRPEALLIDPDNPEHLRGRDDEIRQLSNAVAHRSLVFLEGESGSGKSALVRSGLIPALRAQPATADVLPIYLNAYSGDWDEGLAANLAGAAWRDLGESVRERMGVSTREDVRRRLLIPPTDGAESEQPREDGLLYRIRNELGRTPLLIFDQFDDYQLAHRDRFLRDGRWIAPNVLADENRLWRAVRAALEGQAIHCLFVTRREQFGSLEAVRFQQPETFFLDRVASVFITSLLEQLVTPDSDSGPVVSNPDAGWEALKERLIGDLAGQGRILPIQARVALKGMIELPHLSIGTYERKGGLQGLEAGTIEDATNAAARAADVPPQRVLDALLLLVDETDPEVPKASTAHPGVLVEAIQAEPARVGRILETLVQQGVIRPQIGNQPEDGSNRDFKPDSSRNGSDVAEVAWSLYHDYLARPVLAAHRRANRWQRLLKDRLRAFRSAAGWRERWRALLSPWEQIKLFWPTLTGRVQWRGYRRFALASAIRILPLLGALVVSGFAGNWYLDERAVAQADLILSEISGGLADDIPEREEYRRLWSLATGSTRLKRTFLERAMEDRRSARALAAHAERVDAALLGLDPEGEEGSWALARLLSREPADIPSEKLFFEAKAAALMLSAAPNRFAGLAPEIASLMVEAMTATKDSERLSSLGRALRGLVEHLPAPQAEAIAQQLVAAMTATKNLGQLSSLGEALGGLGEHLPAAQAEAIARQLVAAMTATKDPERLSSLGRALGRLGEHLPAAQAKAIARQLVAVMTATKDPEQLLFLGEALGGLGEHLPAAQAKAGAQQLVAAMTATKEWRQLSSLGWALGGLGEHLPAAQAKAGAQQLVAAMTATKDAWQLSALGEALGGIGEHLPAAQAKAGVLQLVVAMTATKDSGRLYSLGRAQGRLVEHLPATQAEAIAQQLGAAMTATKDSERLSTLGTALGGLGEHLPAAQAEAGAQQLVVAMTATKDSWQLVSLCSALGGLGERLSPAQAGGHRAAAGGGHDRDPRLVTAGLPRQCPGPPWRAPARCAGAGYRAAAGGGHDRDPRLVAAGLPRQCLGRPRRSPARRAG